MKFFSLFLLFTVSNLFRFSASIAGQRDADSSMLRIVAYHATVIPDPAHKSVEGRVDIVFQANRQSDSLLLNKGNLTIDSVISRGKLLSCISDSQTVRIVCRGLEAQNSLSVYYHGVPKSGLVFDEQKGLIYTIFSTSQWMPCIDAPSAKAAFRLQLHIPDTLQCVGNGNLLSRRPLPGGKTEYTWEESTALPTYTFGFAIGRFTEISEQAGNKQLRYLSCTYDSLRMQKIFRETKSMLQFFSEYSGRELADAQYTQVLVPGWEAQELGSFSIIGDGFAEDALKSEDDLGIFIHEFAHQWWGNMVTCVDWRHFWLNEGMATLMVAKYKAWRYGTASRDTEFADIKAGYEKVLKAGKNKPLVFPDWNHPSRDDRRIVYDKGAYVLQLLEDELGPNIFQKGIQAYTKTYWGKSVTSADFQSAMESVAKRSLEVFFKKWVYSAAGEW